MWQGKETKLRASLSYKDYSVISCVSTECTENKEFHIVGPR